MGRLIQQENVLQHFSHVHPLQLFNLQEQQQQQQQQQSQHHCTGCNLPCTGSVYRCVPCNYTLHKSCAQIPQSIKHPAHPSHPLTLLATPTYANCSFSCAACGQQGSAFSFHCPTCEFDLHALCAAFPRRIHHHSHSHELILLYTSPYGEAAYTCDICGAIGSRHWMYRCAACGFNAHLGCATSVAQQQQEEQPWSQSSRPISQPTMSNPLLQRQLPLNDYSAQLFSPMGDQSQASYQMLKATLEAQNRVTNELLMNGLIEAQSRVNDDIRRVLEGQRLSARPTTYPFPVPGVAPSTMLPRPNSSGWVDVLTNGLRRMSLNNMGGGSNVQQGVGVSALGGGFGLQGENQGFGNMENQADSTAPDNLAEMMNGYDWSNLVSGGLNAVAGFM